MPQIKAGKDGQSPIPTVAREAVPFRDRLRNRYAPTDYVRVINIDNEPFSWQYFPVDGEETYFTDDGQMRIVEGRAHYDSRYEQLLPGNEQLWLINPGEGEVLLGANADLFIEGLFKRLVTKKRVSDQPDIKAGEARKFNWNDGTMQERYIDRIFLGVERPQFSEFKPASTK